MALHYCSIRRTVLLAVLLSALTLACCIFFICRKHILHKRSILIIEPEAGQRKLRYSEPKASTTNSLGQVLYKSLGGKASWEVKAISQPTLLSKPETPLAGIRVISKSAKQATATVSNLEVRFEEKDFERPSAPHKLYRIKVAPVKDSEEALKLWSVVQSKNPLFFSQFDSLFDKVFLPDGQVVHYLSMGDYKDFKLANRVCKKLESAGYGALIYEPVY